MARKSRKQTKPKRGAELSFEGFERQLYCWIRKQRSMCAVHKSLYYDFDTPILNDSQYDRLEHQLILVEQRHPEIAQAVTAEGYDSPNDYVGSTRYPSVMSTAQRLYEHWKSKGCPEIPLKHRSKSETDEQLYEEALQHIRHYPI